ASTIRWRLGWLKVLPVRVATSPGSCCPTMRVSSARDWSCSGRPCAGFSRLGVVLDPHYAAADGTLKVLPSATHGLGLEARVYEIGSEDELEAAFSAAARDGMQALYVPEAPLFLTRRTEIADVAARVRLPAIYTFREFVQAGGLMSYGADLPALYQLAAAYVDKILKGAKPGELPLQPAEKFELVVNLKTAKALGLTIPEAFLLRADDVIE